MTAHREAARRPWTEPGVQADSSVVRSMPSRSRKVRHDHQPGVRPRRHKRSTRDQWEQTAEAWHRWGPTLEAWLGPATELMLDLASVTEGSRVLDVAAGAGGQTLAAARRAGPGGRVLATDISPAILAYAESEARSAGLETSPSGSSTGRRWTSRRATSTR